MDVEQTQLADDGAGPPQVEASEPHTPHTPPVEDEASSSALPKKSRAQRLRAKRQADAERARARRAAIKDKRERLTQKGEQLLEETGAAGGNTQPQSPANETGASAPTPPAAAEPAAPAAVPTGANAYAPMAHQLWTQIQRRAEGTRYAFDQGGKETLVEGTAPLMAKWIPQLATTPEAAFVVAVVIVFGPPAVAHLSEAVKTWSDKRDSANAMKA